MQGGVVLLYLKSNVNPSANFIKSANSTTETLWWYIMSLCAKDKLTIDVW